MNRGPMMPAPAGDSSVPAPGLLTAVAADVPCIRDKVADWATGTVAAAVRSGAEFVYLDIAVLDTDCPGAGVEATGIADATSGVELELE